MTDGDIPVATDASGVSTSKVHKSGSGFLPGRFIKGKPGRSKIFFSFAMPWNLPISTPTALTLFRKMQSFNNTEKLTIAFYRWQNPTNDVTNLNNVRFPSVPNSESLCQNKTTMD